MRTLRICGWLLLIPLVLNLGCTKSSYVQKGPEVETNTVKISNCVANPDTVRVHKGGTLIWTIDPPDGHTYSINFPQSTPVSSHTVPIGQTQNVTGDFWCSLLGSISTSACLYGYTPIQDPGTVNKTCPDPGVHVH
jgi:hypothetical protein